MTAALADQFLEVATGLNDVSDVLEGMRAQLTPIAQAHLGVAISSVLNARRQLYLVLSATDPERAPVVSAEPVHHD
jgi:hypothetical protein